MASDLSSNFNRYRALQDQIDAATQLRDTIEQQKTQVKLTLGQKLFPSIGKFFSPNRTGDFTKQEELNNDRHQATRTIGRLHEDLLTARRLLPPLFVHKPEQIAELGGRISTSSQLIQVITTETQQLLVNLDHTSNQITQGMFAEVGDLLLENKHPTKERKWINSIADVLSTRISTRAGDSVGESNAKAANLAELQKKLLGLQQQIAKLTDMAMSKNDQQILLPHLPNLNIIEYGDLIQDMIFQGTDIGSVFSFLAQGYTGVKVHQLKSKLQDLLAKCAEFQITCEKLTEQIALYQQLDAARRATP